MQIVRTPVQGDSGMLAFGRRPSERTRELQAVMIRLTAKKHEFRAATDHAKKAAAARELLAIEQELRELPNTPF